MRNTLIEFDVTQILVLFRDSDVVSGDVDKVCKVFSTPYSGHRIVFGVTPDKQLKIPNWQYGELSVCLKLVDMGGYIVSGYLGSQFYDYLLQDCYVPSFLPSHGGDYLDFEVDQEGYVKGFKISFEEVWEELYPNLIKMKD